MSLSTLVRTRSIDTVCQSMANNATVQAPVNAPCWSAVVTSSAESNTLMYGARYGVPRAATKSTDTLFLPTLSSLDLPARLPSPCLLYYCTHARMHVGSTQISRPSTGSKVLPIQSVPPSEGARLKPSCRARLLQTDATVQIRLLLTKSTSS